LKAEKRKKGRVEVCRMGGRARARALSRERRVEIARQGGRAFAAKMRRLQWFEKQAMKGLIAPQQ
jgi:general stress protein YciG